MEQTSPLRLKQRGGGIIFRLHVQSRSSLIRTTTRALKRGGGGGHFSERIHREKGISVNNAQLTSPLYPDDLKTD